MITKSGKRNHSALSKLVPAVAMFVTSAVMLSTSTYAWFTMNKEVTMTGLNMSATAGEGLDISLGESATVGDMKNLPSEESTTWNNKVTVSDIYKTIGKIKPASSVDGKNFFEAKEVEDTGESTSLDYSKIVNGAAGIDFAENATVDSGYYVEIPVHIRTTKAAGSKTEGNLNCKVNVTCESDLKNAVRVAFDPIEPLDAGTTNIFGIDDGYFETGKAVQSESQKGSVTVKIADTAYDETGLKIKYANSPEKYGYLSFYVRVWLEGESASCKLEDGILDKPWNVEINFTLGEDSTP